MFSQLLISFVLQFRLSRVLDLILLCLSVSISEYLCYTDWNEWPVQLLFRGSEVHGSYLGSETGNLHRFSVVFLSVTRKVSDNVLINATIVSFRILSSSLFASLDATHFEILAASLNQDKRRSPAAFSDRCFVYLYRRD
jgi:hypothetical protein